MRNRKAITAAVLGALLACGNAAMAGGSDEGSGYEVTSKPMPQLTLQPNYLADTPAAPAGRRPLMDLLDKAGVAGGLDKAGINIYGHIEGSYTWNFDDPDSKLNPFRIFDFEHNTPLLNQIDLTVERLVDYRKNAFDIGFRIEALYGADAGIIHSNGMFDYYDGIRNPKNQFDIPAGYIDIDVPVGTGLRVRIGKFANFVGYESINPSTNPTNETINVDFYSRSLIFFNYPFTHTGALLTYDLSKSVTLTAGISRGDNQSTEDNNNGVSFLGSVRWAISDELTLYVSNSTGPEEPDNTRDIRSSFDATLYYLPAGSRWSFTANGYLVYEESGAVDGSNAYLYAVAGLAAYKLNDVVTLKGRGEWIHDDDGFRLGPVHNIYEATIGATIHPFPSDKTLTNLKIRPELRWDYSPDGPFNGDNSQLTFGIDAIFNF